MTGYNDRLDNMMAVGGRLPMRGNVYAKAGPLRRKPSGNGFSPNAQYAMRYFMNKGLAPYQAAGLVGNLMRESGLNPSAVNPSSKAYGLAQWLGARKRKLFSMYGNSPSLQNQLDFVWWELNNTHKNGLKYLAASRNAEEAAKAGMNWFEFSNGDAIAEMNKWGQDGRGSMRKGIEFATRLAGQPMPALAYLDAPSRQQMQMPKQMQQPMDYQPLHPELLGDAAFSSYMQPHPVERRPQPLLDMANEYYEQEMRKQERERGMRNFATVLGILNSGEGDSLVDAFRPLLDNARRRNMAARGGRLYDGVTEPTNQMKRWKTVYEYQPTGDIDRLTFRDNNPLDAWWGDIRLDPIDKGDHYAYRYKNHQWTVPKSKWESGEELNPHQRLERDWEKSPAYGFDKVMLGTLVGSSLPFVLPEMAAGVTALGDAAATTTVGKGITSLLANPYFDAGLTSYFGAHGLNDAKNGNANAMTALEVMPLMRVGKAAYEVGKPLVKELYDNGTLWDNYTTFRGRLGNYGDNLATNIYGTLARRYGLPDKARIPADAMRKISEPIRVENGLVDFTGDKGFGGNYHINMTLDRPTVSHHWWVGDGADTYIMPTRSFLEQTKGSLKSIEPSDMFANGARVQELPQNVTLISGDIEALNKARETGMQTLSSPRLRRMYKEKINAYQKELQRVADLPPEEQYLVKSPAHPKVVKNDRGQDYWPEYAAEVQRLQARRGTPTLEDFRLLEQQTGLNAGVAPIAEYYNALNQIKTLPFDENGIILPLIYPNGREAIISSPSKWQKEERLLNTPYNKVFYDPASAVESDWRTSTSIK